MNIMATENLMFSMRIVTADSYMADPVPGLDPTHSEFRKQDIRSVPVVRIFGSTPCGQRTCLHLHGVFPYLMVPYCGPDVMDSHWTEIERYMQQMALSIDSALNSASGKGSSSRQHVYKITLLRGIPFYGYHQEEELFLKIFLYLPGDVKRSAELLQAGAVMNRQFQPHEAHVPYILQLFMDYNLYGMNLLHTRNCWFRTPLGKPDPLNELPTIKRPDDVNPDTKTTVKRAAEEKERDSEMERCHAPSISQLRNFNWNLLRERASDSQKRGPQHEEVEDDEHIRSSRINVHSDEPQPRDDSGTSHSPSCSNLCKSLMSRTLSDTQNDTELSRKDRACMCPLHTLWTSRNIPSSFRLPPEVERHSTRELEVDVIAADISNRNELLNSEASNPGLASIWEDERARRRERGEDSQIAPDQSQLRVIGEDLSETEARYVQMLYDALDKYREECSMSSFNDSLPTSAQDTSRRRKSSDDSTPLFQPSQEKKSSQDITRRESRDLFSDSPLSSGGPSSNQDKDSQDAATHSSLEPLTPIVSQEVVSQVMNSAKNRVKSSQLTGNASLTPDDESVLRLLQMLEQSNDENEQLNLSVASQRSNGPLDGENEPQADISSSQRLMRNLSFSLPDSQRIDSDASTQLNESKPPPSDDEDEIENFEMSQHWDSAIWDLMHDLSKDDTQLECNSSEDEIPQLDGTSDDPVQEPPPFSVAMNKRLGCTRRCSDLLPPASKEESFPPMCKDLHQESSESSGTSQESTSKDAQTEQVEGAGNTLEEYKATGLGGDSEGDVLETQGMIQMEGDKIGPKCVPEGGNISCSGDSPNRANPQLSPTSAVTNPEATPITKFRDEKSKAEVCATATDKKPRDSNSSANAECLGITRGDRETLVVLNPTVIELDRGPNHREAQDESNLNLPKKSRKQKVTDCKILKSSTSKPKVTGDETKKALMKEKGNSAGRRGSVSARTHPQSTGYTYDRRALTETLALSRLDVPVDPSAVVDTTPSVLSDTNAMATTCPGAPPSGNPPDHRTNVFTTILNENPNVAFYNKETAEPDRYKHSALVKFGSLTEDSGKIDAPLVKITSTLVVPDVETLPKEKPPRRRRKPKVEKEEEKDAKEEQTESTGRVRRPRSASRNSYFDDPLYETVYSSDWDSDDSFSFTSEEEAHRRRSRMRQTQRRRKKKEKVVYKWIIVNRFKGMSNMKVSLWKIPPTRTVKLTPQLLDLYELYSPRKEVAPSPPVPPPPLPATTKSRPMGRRSKNMLAKNCPFGPSNSESAGDCNDGSKVDEGDSSLRKDDPVNSERGEVREEGAEGNPNPINIPPNQELEKPPHPCPWDSPILNPTQHTHDTSSIAKEPHHPTDVDFCTHSNAVENPNVTSSNELSDIVLKLSTCSSEDDPVLPRTEPPTEKQDLKVDEPVAKTKKQVLAANCKRDRFGRFSRANPKDKAGENPRGSSVDGAKRVTDPVASKNEKLKRESKKRHKNLKKSKLKFASPIKSSVLCRSPAAKNNLKLKTEIRKRRIKMKKEMKYRNPLETDADIKDGPEQLRIAKKKKTPKTILPVCSRTVEPICKSPMEAFLKGEAAPPNPPPHPGPLNEVNIFSKFAPLFQENQPDGSNELNTGPWTRNDLAEKQAQSRENSLNIFTQLEKDAAPSRSWDTYKSDVGEVGSASLKHASIVSATNFVCEGFNEEKGMRLTGTLEDAARKQKLISSEGVMGQQSNVCRNITGNKTDDNMKVSPELGTCQDPLPPINLSEKLPNETPTAEVWKKRMSGDKMASAASNIEAPATILRRSNSDGTAALLGSRPHKTLPTTSPLSEKTGEKQTPVRKIYAPCRKVTRRSVAVKLKSISSPVSMFSSTMDDSQEDQPTLNALLSISCPSPSLKPIRDILDLPRAWSPLIRNPLEEEKEANDLLEEFAGEFESFSQDASKMLGIDTESMFKNIDELMVDPAVNLGDMGPLDHDVHQTVALERETKNQDLSNDRQLKDFNAILEDVSSSVATPKAGKPGTSTLEDLEEETLMEFIDEMTSPSASENSHPNTQPPTMPSPSETPQIPKPNLGKSSFSERPPPANSQLDNACVMKSPVPPGRILPSRPASAFPAVRNTKHKDPTRQLYSQRNGNHPWQGPSYAVDQPITAPHSQPILTPPPQRFKNYPHHHVMGHHNTPNPSQTRHPHLTNSVPPMPPEPAPFEKQHPLYTPNEMAQITHNMHPSNLYHYNQNRPRSCFNAFMGNEKQSDSMFYQNKGSASQPPNRPCESYTPTISVTHFAPEPHSINEMGGPVPHPASVEPLQVFHTHVHHHHHVHSIQDPKENGANRAKKPTAPIPSQPHPIPVTKNMKTERGAKNIKNEAGLPQPWPNTAPQHYHNITPQQPPSITPCAYTPSCQFYPNVPGSQSHIDKNNNQRPTLPPSQGQSCQTFKLDTSKQQVGYDGYYLGNNDQQQLVAYVKPSCGSWQPTSTSSTNDRDKFCILMKETCVLMNEAHWFNVSMTRNLPYSLVRAAGSTKRRKNKGKPSSSKQGKNPKHVQAKTPYGMMKQQSLVDAGRFGVGRAARIPERKRKTISDFRAPPNTPTISLAGAGNNRSCKTDQGGGKSLEDSFDLSQDIFETSANNGSLLECNNSDKVKGGVQSQGGTGPNVEGILSDTCEEMDALKDSSSPRDEEMVLNFVTGEMERVKSRPVIEDVPVLFEPQEQTLGSLYSAVELQAHPPKGRGAGASQSKPKKSGPENAKKKKVKSGKSIEDLNSELEPRERREMHSAKKGGNPKESNMEFGEKPSDTAPEYMVAKVDLRSDSRKLKLILKKAVTPARGKPEIACLARVSSTNDPVAPSKGHVRQARLKSSEVSIVDSSSSDSDFEIAAPRKKRKLSLKLHSDSDSDFRIDDVSDSETASSSDCERIPKIQTELIDFSAFDFESHIAAVCSMYVVEPKRAVPGPSDFLTLLSETAAHTAVCALHNQLPASKGRKTKYRMLRELISLSKNVPKAKTGRGSKRPRSPGYDDYSSFFDFDASDKLLMPDFYDSSSTFYEGQTVTSAPPQFAPATASCPGKKTIIVSDEYSPEYPSGLPPIKIHCLAKKSERDPNLIRGLGNLTGEESRSEGESDTEGQRASQETSQADDARLVARQVIDYCCAEIVKRAAVKTDSDPVKPTLAGTVTCESGKDVGAGIPTDPESVSAKEETTLTKSSPEQEDNVGSIESKGRVGGVLSASERPDLNLPNHVPVHVIGQGSNSAPPYPEKGKTPKEGSEVTHPQSNPPKSGWEQEGSHDDPPNPSDEPPQDNTTPEISELGSHVYKYNPKAPTKAMVEKDMKMIGLNNELTSKPPFYSDPTDVQPSSTRLSDLPPYVKKPKPQKWGLTAQEYESPLTVDGNLHHWTVIAAAHAPATPNENEAFRRQLADVLPEGTRIWDRVDAVTKLQECPAVEKIFLNRSRPILLRPACPPPCRKEVAEWLKWKREGKAEQGIAVLQSKQDQKGLNKEPHRPPRAQAERVPDKPNSIPSPLRRSISLTPSSGHVMKVTRRRRVSFDLSNLDELAGSPSPTQTRGLRLKRRAGEKKGNSQKLSKVIDDEPAPQINQFAENPPSTPIPLPFESVTSPSSSRKGEWGSTLPFDSTPSFLSSERQSNPEDGSSAIKTLVGSSESSKSSPFTLSGAFTPQTTPKPNSLDFDPNSLKRDQHLQSTPNVGPEKRRKPALRQLSFTPISESDKDVDLPPNTQKDPTSPISRPLTPNTKGSCLRKAVLGRKFQDAPHKMDGEGEYPQNSSPPIDSDRLLSLESPQLTTKKEGSQIDGPTLDNTYGFKVEQQHLGEAKSLHVVQHLTLLSIELHVKTRIDLRPDPEMDEIRGLFYCLDSDSWAGQDEGLRTGAIVVDPESVPDKPSSQEPSTSTAHLENFSYRRGLFQKAGVSTVNTEYVGSEADLFLAFARLVQKHDPDILVGYEVQMLSWGFLLQRAAHLRYDLCRSLSCVPNDEARNRYSLKDDVYGADNASELHIVGRIVLNLWRLMRTELALYDYSFESVAYHLLHERHPCYEFQTLTNWYDAPRRSGEPADSSVHRKRVIDYYITRTRANLRLLVQQDLVGRTSELARLFGFQFYDVLTRGTQYRVESMMLRTSRSRNLVAVTPSILQRAQMRAPEVIALVLEPESKFYHVPVIVLDFQSLYPSMVIAYNLCFSTCLGRVEHLGSDDTFTFGCTTLRIPAKTLRKLLRKNQLTITPSGVAFVRPSVKRGVMPQMLDEILTTRIMVKNSIKKCRDPATKRMLDHRQLGLKLIANVTYGYTAANYSGRMPCVEVGDSIVHKARETLERAIHLVNKRSRAWDAARVVYGDTDSMFIAIEGVDGNGCTKERAFEIGREIAAAVTADNPTPVKLRFEKVYLPCILQTKKRYVGYAYESENQVEPSFDAKGIETVRRDGTPATSKILEKMLRTLFETRDVSKVKEYVLKQCSKLLDGRTTLQDCIIAKEYRGKEYYKAGAVVPALNIAKKLVAMDRRAEPRVGERVPYVIVHGAPGTPLYQLVRTPLEVLKDPSLQLNGAYYVSKHVLPALDRMMSLVGVDVFMWHRHLPRVVSASTNFDTYANSQSNATKKSTISHFFKSKHCLMCKKLSVRSICEECSSGSVATRQSTAVKLSLEANALEREKFHIEQVCMQCSGADSTHNIRCVSLDCPVLYKYHRSATDNSKVKAIRRVLSEEGMF